jgi:hypothetical protein
MACRLCRWRATCPRTHYRHPWGAKVSEATVRTASYAAKRVLGRNTVKQCFRSYFCIFSDHSFSICQAHQNVSSSVVEAALRPCSFVKFAGMFDPSRPSLYVCQRDRRGTVLSKISDLRGIYRSISQVILLPEQRRGMMPVVLGL